jgi:putative glycosyltransferase
MLSLAPLPGQPPSERAPPPAAVDLSVVATLYRSAGFLEEFHRRIKAELERLTPSYEVVLVNDGSPDASLEKALALHRADPRVRVVDLSRNFGHHKAMMTGLRLSRGRRVFLIDSDLEEPPELLGEFHRQLGEEEADVVYGVQQTRKGGLFERVSGALFFRVFNLLSATPLPANLTTVRLMTRRYVDALAQHQEREMIIAGLWAITGFKQVPRPVQKGSRGATSYGLRQKIVHLVNSVTAFSDRPLVLIFYLGLAISILATAAAVYLVARRLFFGVLLAGWPSLIVSVWLLGGLTLLSLGVIGIYVSKVFIETKQRPYTIVRETYDRTDELD